MKTIRRPFYPGYLFAKIDVPFRVPGSSHLGYVLDGSGQAATLTEDSILSLKTFEEEDHRATEYAARMPKHCYRAGDRVVIKSGPMATRKATVESLKGETGLQLLIKMGRNKVPLPIDAAQVSVVKYVA